jgi:hypothetical protein
MLKNSFRVAKTKGQAIGFDNGFLGMTPKAWVTKGKY